MTAAPRRPAQPDDAVVLSLAADAERRAAMLDSILENVPHGVCVYGPDRRVRLFNPAYVEIMDGAPLAVGDHLTEVIRRRADAGEFGSGPPDLIYTQQMAHDISRPQVRRRRRPNGRTVDVRTAPLPDGGHISVVTDVTPLMQAEQALERRAGEMEAMLAHLQHGITLFDADGRLVAANQIAARLLNLPPDMLTAGRSEEEILRRLAALGELGGRDAAQAFMRERLGRDRTRSTVYRRSTPDGRVLQIRTDPVPGRGVINTYTDVTDQERLQEEQRRAVVAAEAANQAKSRFLATMSHELRTPLNAVIGFSEALLRQAEGGDPARLAEFATAINESGRHLLGLINTILDVARIEAGRVEVAADRVDISRLALTCLRLAAPAFLAGEISVGTELQQALPPIWGDERRLQQVLSNLLSNAAKFTPAGGEVTVRASLAEDGGMVVQVADTGIGIAEADLERVFEPFLQLDGALNRRFQGAGLGLYMCRSLVEAHGGRLRLRSKVGVGTVAEIVLPAWRLIAEPSNVNEGVATA